MRWRLARRPVVFGCVAWRDRRSCRRIRRRDTAPVVRWRLALPGWGEPAADASAAYFLTRTHEVVVRRRRHRRRSRGGATPAAAATSRRARRCAWPAPRVIVGDGGIVAFDRASGRRMWRFERARRRRPRRLPRRASTPTWSSPARRWGVSMRSTPRRGRSAWTRDVVGWRAARRVRAGSRRRARSSPSFTTFDGPLSGGLVAFDRTGTAPVDASVRRRRRRSRVRRSSSATSSSSRAPTGASKRCDRDVWPARVDAGAGAVAAGRRCEGATSAPSPRCARSARGDVAERPDPRLRRPDAASSAGRYGDGPIDAVALRVRVYGDQRVRARTPTARWSRSTCGPGTERWRIGAGRRFVRLAPRGVRDIDLRGGRRGALGLRHPRRSSRLPRPEAGGSRPLKGATRRCPSSRRTAHDRPGSSSRSPPAWHCPGGVRRAAAHDARRRPGLRDRRHVDGHDDRPCRRTGDVDVVLIGLERRRHRDVHADLRRCVGQRAGARAGADRRTRQRSTCRINLTTNARDCPGAPGLFYTARLTLTGNRMTGTYEPAIGCPLLRGGSLELTQAMSRRRLPGAAMRSLAPGSPAASWRRGAATVAARPPTAPTPPPIDLSRTDTPLGAERRALPAPADWQRPERRSGAAAVQSDRSCRAAASS